MQRKRKRRPGWRPPDLTEAQVLAWAAAHRARTGRRPTCRDPVQAVSGAAGETWFNVDQALRKGLRGLPGGSSLSRLLGGRRGAADTVRSRRTPTVVESSR